MLYSIYATVKTRGSVFRALPALFRRSGTPQTNGRPVSPFRAFATSLAGTIGVGNITGVSIAIGAGGPGALFWMWVSALLCMTVKYFEVYLAVKHQPAGEDRYGFAPMEYLKKATESKGYALCFALFGLISALAMGSMIQTNAAAEAARTAFGVPAYGTGILFTIGAGIVISGGIRRVGGLLERMVPVLGGLFLLTGIAVIALRCREIPSAFAEIFKGAFSLKSASGGLLGSGIALSFRYGVGNGLFSHEAGLGSAGIAHGASGAKPEKQGLWGAFEVFADTILISTVSGLMILTCRVPASSGSVLAAAESVLGFAGKGILALCLILFAFLSVLSWSSYGEACFVWICGKETALIYRILFLLTPFPGAILKEGLLWDTAQIVNGGMLILNLTGLLGYREELSAIAGIGRRKNREIF